MHKFPPHHILLKENGHRPWPIPSSSWQWQQSWLNLFFIHIPIPAASLRPLIPMPLEIETYDHTAWLGIVGFRMAHVAPRSFLFLTHAFGTFPELNLRTYVTYEDKPGVWFFSLDATSLPLVLGGRHLFYLPYYLAKARHTQPHATAPLHFSSMRVADKTSFEATVTPASSSFLAAPGTFAHWATERYCLYSQSREKKLQRIQVAHPPWPLQEATGTISRCDLLQAAQLPSIPIPSAPHTLYSTGVHVLTFSRETCL